MKKFILVSALMLHIFFVWGQISVSNTTPVTQNFNGMLATNSLPANWKMHASTSSPTYTGGSTTLTQQASTGSPATGGTYNWGSTASERAVGAMTSGGFASPNNLMVFYKNTNSTDNITQLSIDYKAERYRINTAAASIQFFYSSDGIAWTAVTTGDITNASFPTGASSYSFASPLTITKTGVIISSLSIAPNSDFYLRWNINTTGSNSQGIGLDDVSVTATYNVPTTTITTGTITGGPFTVDCLTGDAGNVAFTTSGNFSIGNTFTVQLSSSTGSFASPTTIGTLTGLSAEGLNLSGLINFTIPSATITSASYLIRIIASNPSITGSNSNQISNTLLGGPCTLDPPHLTSVIINSCDGECTEGNNELVFGTSGDYSFDVNSTNFNFFYGTNLTGTNYTDILVNNAPTINLLNSAAGCGTLFIDATGTTIPSNSNWMLASTALCAEALTWNGLCSSGPIYVIFQNDLNWSSGGNFANNPGSPGIRYYRTNITTTAGIAFTIDYTTDGAYPNSDGVFATFDIDGGASTSYSDNNCILNPILLPSELISFYGLSNNEINNLFWQTSSEQNNDYYTINHSTDGYNFSQLTQLDGAGNSDQMLSYNFDHVRPAAGINYYKLSSTDFDGTTYLKGIIAVNTKRNLSFYNPITSSIELNSKSSIDLFSLDGKLILTAEKTTQIPFNQPGIYLLVNQLTGETERIFIPK
jgi:hypothetical protein